MTNTTTTASDGYMVYHIRRKGNRPVATLVAVPDPSRGTVFVGWSLCHRYDEFTKETGRRIALSRAYTASKKYTTTLSRSPEESTLPKSLYSQSQFRPQIKRFMEMCRRAYKTDMMVWY